MAGDHRAYFDKSRYVDVETINLETLPWGACASPRGQKGCWAAREVDLFVLCPQIGLVYRKASTWSKHGPLLESQAKEEKIQKSMTLTLKKRWTMHETVVVFSWEQTVLIWKGELRSCHHRHWQWGQTNCLRSFGHGPLILFLSLTRSSRVSRPKG